MIDAARASGHRVFAIGVGSSPAEGVLRSLAEATGGACEFATPGEALEAAVPLAPGKVLINSVTAEDHSLERLLPLVARFGAGAVFHDLSSIPPGVAFPDHLRAQLQRAAGGLLR